jgi:lipopolysaccharide cholinephosphotransferase
MVTIQKPDGNETKNHGEMMKDIIKMSDVSREEYYVSDMMKKVWAVELDLLREFDAVCQKHSLKYFAGFGTLLGVVRHQGFIPWDDDIDLWMLRDDYEKLKTVAKEEFKGKYYFQDWYNSCGRTWIFSKLRNSETTAVEYPEKGVEFNQGIFIDIFPIDEFDDGIHVNPEFKQIQKELFNCINNPIDMLKGILAGKQYALGMDMVVTLANDYIQAQHLFDRLTLENFGQSDIVGYFYDEMRGNDRRYPKSVFDEAIYLPFENTMIPVPKEYDIILRKYYGDYMIPVKQPNNHQSRIILDPDRPYTEYLVK